VGHPEVFKRLKRGLRDVSELAAPVGFDRAVLLVRRIRISKITDHNLVDDWFHNGSNAPRNATNSLGSLISINGRDGKAECVDKKSRRWSIVGSVSRTSATTKRRRASRFLVRFDRVGLYSGSPAPGV